MTLAMQKISADVQRRFTQGWNKISKRSSRPLTSSNFLSVSMRRSWASSLKKEELPGGKSVERVLTADELRQQLVPAMGVEESELRLLAQGRAKAIRERLIEQGGLPEDRVFLVEVELAQSGRQTDQSPSRVWSVSVSPRVRMSCDGASGYREAESSIRSRSAQQENRRGDLGRIDAGAFEVAFRKSMPQRRSACRK
ncbi:MAG: hypothetical protein MRJ92_04710 [Nitrospira sp.]|nr:hypothetical protein [Nitrospira sp.]